MRKMAILIVCALALGSLAQGYVWEDPLLLGGEQEPIIVSDLQEGDTITLEIEGALDSVFLSPFAGFYAFNTASG